METIHVIEDSKPPAEFSSHPCVKDFSDKVVPFSVISVPGKKPKKAFYRKFFPDATAQDVNDWKWQLRNRITNLEALQRIIKLSPDELAAFESHQTKLPMAITPHYLSLIDPKDPNQPLRKTMIPTQQELIHGPGEAEDPLNEEACSPIHGLTHRYPDRVLFLVTDYCSSYCRYCTRSRMVGCGSSNCGSQKHWEEGIAYIRAHTEIRDVLLSGGDPLTMEDEKLEWLLTQIRAIPHVEIIRIGTKVPMVLPQRITPKLCKILKKFHPLFISIHCAHPDELCVESKKACNRLADAGIPLGSQTVLLAGINDNVPTMKKLMQGLLQVRVRPYYIYQCDPILGSAHFRTSVSKGLEIIAGLRGHTTGYAVPSYVIDAPGGGGKIPLLPEYYVGKEGNEVILRNYEGKTFRYPDVKNCE